MLVGGRNSTKRRPFTREGNIIGHINLFVAIQLMLNNRTTLNKMVYEWNMSKCRQSLPFKDPPPLDFCTVIVHEIILSKSIGPTKSISDKKA